MSTIQVEREVKRELFYIAAELQSRLGRRISLNDVIKQLINIYRSANRDVSGMLSLFGCLGTGDEAFTLLKELRGKEDERLGRVEGRYRA